MSTSIAELQWNADGELAKQRLRDRGIVKFSADEYMREFKQVQRERRELEAWRHETVRGYITNTQEEMGIRSYAQAQKAVCSSLKLFAESGVTAKHRLARVLSAAKASDTGKIDTRLAMDMMRMMPDDVIQAANVRLDELGHEKLKEISRGGPSAGATLQQAMSIVLKENPSLKAAVNDGSVSRDLLEILFWPVSHVFE